MKSNIAIYDELARLDPRNPLFVDGQPSTYVKLADCYRKAGERDNARRAIEMALDLYAAVEARHALDAEQKQIRDDARTTLAALPRE
jgi:Flp pilus assembly protein TadD